jgi:DNA-binding transcriptional LysR family regulator
VDKLRAMRSFVAIADAGSLTAAARSQGSSLPAVVRLLAALESELGVRLFHRTTRRIALTDAGRRYLERCRELLGLMDEAEAELTAQQTEPRGELRVTAPVLFGQRHVVAGVTGFAQRYPQVDIQVVLLDRVVNMVEEGIDVGIRIGVLDDSSLIAQHVGTMRRLTVAAPSYLERKGVPEHPRELLAHNCVRSSGAGTSEWTFSDNGKPVTVRARGNLSFNHAAAAADACVAGLGVGNFFAYQVAPFLANGALRVMLERFERPPRPIHIVYPEARLLPARTRAFIDFIKRHLLGQQAAWQPVAPGEHRTRASAAARAKGGLRSNKSARGPRKVAL